jgi:1-acyl-sn-glycerol-3-phosphate acyltransferase
VVVAPVDEHVVSTIACRRNSKRNNVLSTRTRMRLLSIASAAHVINHQTFPCPASIPSHPELGFCSHLCASPNTDLWVDACECDAAMPSSSPPPPSIIPSISSLFRAAIHVLLFVAHLCAANTLLTLLLVYSFLVPTLTYNLASLIAASVWTHIQHIFTHTNGARILVTGDSLPQNESAIVLSNHVEWSDFYMIQELALRANMLGRCRWFAKKELKWVPFLGWGLWAMGMPLVSRKWMQDERELQRVFDGVARRKWPICTFCCSSPCSIHISCRIHVTSTPSFFLLLLVVMSKTTIVDNAKFSPTLRRQTQKDTLTNTRLGLISFSEGTRLTPKKRLLAAEHALKTNKVLPEHLLLPRTKGFAACVQHLRTAAPHVKAVYDLTIAYADLKPSGLNQTTTKKKEQANGNGNGHPNSKSHPPSDDFAFQSPPTFIQSLFYPNIASRWRTLVHVRRFEISSLPVGEAELRAWLEERWIEKGEVLEELRRKLERGEEWEDGKGK